MGRLTQRATRLGLLEFPGRRGIDSGLHNSKRNAFRQYPAMSLSFRPEFDEEKDPRGQRFAHPIRHIT